ncbi:neural-cadherin-like isoform X1 [Haliotis cracherodii]|uniref:neural-cadherin-like isoform X1 n=1 Tax=Haliotis cracherodii TaxID=6455 RepID=UPI0039ED704D
MAASMNRCVCKAAILLHSFLVFVSSIHGLRSQDHNIIYMQDVDFNSEISPYLTHHRHARSRPYHERVKRDATLAFQRTLAENITFTEPIFQLSTQVNGPHTFEIVSSTVDMFTVGSTSGNVALKPGRTFDYEDDTQRSIQLVIKATNQNNITDVTQITLTLTVTDVNDANPEFKNKPYPFLTTVGPNTPPNEEVFRVVAEDPDTNSNISYRIDSGGNGRFYISTETVPLDGTFIKVGNIYTKGQGRFEDGREFNLVVFASDDNATPPQSTMANVFVKVGLRPPQFYENPFRGTVRENNGIDQTLNGEFKVEAKAFQGNAISYELRDATNATSAQFSIDSSGVVKTLQVLEFDVPREQRPPIYELNVFATESVTSLQSTVKLFIEVLDDNDNSPIFELSRYSARFPEDLPIDQTVLEVKAVDDDSGTNAEVAYSISHENFYVVTENRTTPGVSGMEYVGIIKVKKRLDYDRLPGHVYSFTVTATDKGSPPNTGTTSVQVFMTNVNDEPPEISLGNQKQDVREDAKVGDAVTVIQAIDLDKDSVEFYFSPRLTDFKIFRILPASGLITLSQTVPADVDEYVLNITAYDDGSCCGGSPILSSEAYLNVEIVDINTHKPSFPQCSTYNNATILEAKPQNTHVTRVQAEDNDRGENGRVTYSILRAPTNVQVNFRIDEDTGDVSSAVEFDREVVSSYTVTIRGVDQGTPPLDGYCTFTISIGDINDNKPVFDLQSYTATISQTMDVGRSILTVRANDEDLGENAEIEYSMVDSDGGIFRIDNEAGIIFLNKTLGTKQQYDLTVMAKDKGVPPLNSTASVSVRVIDLTSQPPTWNRNDYDTNPYTVDETAVPGHIIASFSATSNVDNPTVSFSLIAADGSPVQSLPPFGITSGGGVVNLTVFSVTMDFNVKNRYELRLRVSNRGSIPLSSEIHPVVELRDTNNKVPYFRGLDSATGFYPGSIPENSPPGQTVIEIKAYDDDPTYPNNFLTFEIVPKVNISDKFSIRKIDDNTAVLTSRASFDREETSQLYVDVKVYDGVESSRPGHTAGQPNTAVVPVQVRITDMNDNSPYFVKSLYNASVREDAPVQEHVLSVSARDPDDAAVLTYTIKSGNERGAFGVWSKTGIIYVGRQLDYETEQHLYDLTLEVSDGIYSNTTRVNIHVSDANDNSPVFVTDPYVILDVVEEDTSITASNKRFLVQVNATDADIDRPTQIRYSLLGFGTSPPNKYFEIEPDTGRLYLLTSLDRDLPSGRPNYQFNIRAQDEPDPSPGSADLDRPQIGFASVQVKPIDINDNKPIFISKLEGSVMEHSARGSSVMTVVAIDYDEGINGTVKYEIVEGPSDGSDMKFQIRESSGLIETSTNSSGLDRETTPTYTVKVKASDRGVVAQSIEKQVIINLDDKNDQVPVFEKPLYKVTMSEAQTSGAIARVRATDNDIGENARLDYRLNNFISYFDVEGVNNEGSIVVFRAVDYENPDQRFFNLTVVVQDPDPTHTATTHVEVTVEDFNDNAPEFERPRIAVAQYEDAAVGTFLAHFSADDKDSGINADFEYSVDRKTDPNKLFSIDQLGNVTIRNMLDRETESHHKVYILAIDKGDPAQTGTGTLEVTVKDVNDNFPIFAKPYHPIVMENAAVVPELVIIVNATDLDASPFGDPFGFSEPTCSDGSNTCPCSSKPTCTDFSLVFNPDGDNKKGNADISTKKVFDREQQKFYYMPIVMWDMRGSGDARAQTGTNTLTIEIGDLNDNVHSPGHKDIFVYNYKGMFGPLEIGNVYATDPDDWDVVDKTFKYTGPEYMKKYFSVNVDTGMITMAKGVPGDNPYSFTVDVYDKVWQKTVQSTVTVMIRDISEEAVFSSGSVRLRGITAEDFVARPKKPNGGISDYDPSMYDKFQAFIADKIAVPKENVDVMSVQNNGEFTDVRFSAHGSPYYPSSKMNAVLAVNKDSLQKTVGIEVDQVPIDECKDERFEGSCYNFLNVTGKPAMVNTNGTSFVGVQMFVQPTQGCRSDFYPPSDECTPDYCYNGGTCNKDDWGELSCSCLPGSNGPRCQGTHHSFDGTNYALYDPLEQCEFGRTSLHIITLEENGLIMYNGPVDDFAPGSDDPTDFISLELSGGYPRLRIDHGSGTLELYVDGRDAHGIAKMQKLSDGKWHRIDIVRNGQQVEMIVDHCERATLEPGGTVSDDKMCRATGTTPGENVYLNVNTLLQLGGRYSTPNKPTGIMPTKFNGCVKNLMHNSRLYDLTVPGNPGYPAGENTCRREDIICDENSINGPKCGENGICESTWQPDTTMCICKPGWFGNKCERVATIKDLEQNSFIQYRLKDQFFNNVSSRVMKMQILFRTRDRDGVLWTISTSSGSMVTTLQIVDGILTLTYNMGNGIRNLELSRRFVSNGQWHTAQVERNGREFVLKMDNMEGANYNFTYGFPDDKQELHMHNMMFAGAIVSFSNSLPVLASDLEDTCLQDIRLNHEWFPMEVSEQILSNAAEIQKVSHVKDGCVRTDCIGHTCPPERVCYPLWGHYECRCPEHFEEIDGECQRINYCANHRCFNGSTCQEDLSEEKNYVCVCPPDWVNEYCDQVRPAGLLAGITTGAIVAIIVSIFVLLVLAVAIILLVKCGRRPSPDDKYILEVDPEDDIRENVINYDEEGAGEEDHDAYDIHRLRKPDAESLHKPPLDTMPRRDMPRRNAPGESPDVGNFIDDRLVDADDDDNAPPHDAVREFVYEGEGSDAGSLSSLNTSSSISEQDYDYLNDWGPKFAKLADMYGAGMEPGEEDV